MLSKNSSVSVLERLTQIVVEVGELDELGCLLRRLRKYSHWPAKFSTSACAFGSASMRRTCRSSTAGFFSSPWPPRRAVRRPECCSTGRTTAATPARDSLTAVRSPADASGGSCSMRKMNSGDTKILEQRQPDSGCEAVRRGTSSEQRDEGRQIVSGNRSTVGAAREARDDPFRASALLGSRHRMADENPFAARRIAWPQHIVGPGDRKRWPRLRRSRSCRRSADERAPSVA